MHTNKLSYVLLATFCSVTAARADQAACIGILDRVNYNIMRSSSSEQQAAMTKANFCSSDYDKASSSEKANIEASYGLFSGSAGASADSIRERQKSECGGQFGSYWYDKANLSEQKIAVVEALNTVTKCEELAQDKKLKIRTVISEDNSQLSFSIGWNSAGTLKVKYAGPSPWNLLQCYVDGKEVKAPDDLSASVDAFKEWTFSCNRQLEPITIAGESVSCAPPINISVSTDQVSDTIPIPRACSTDYLISRAKQVEDKVASLGDNITTAQSDMRTLTQNIATLKNGLDTQLSSLDLEKRSIRYIFASQGDGCPAGWTDLGFIGVILRNDYYGNNLGVGGPLNAGWTWTHPKLCHRN